MRTPFFLLFPSSPLFFFFILYTQENLQHKTLGDIECLVHPAIYIYIYVYLAVAQPIINHDSY